MHAGQPCEEQQSFLSLSHFTFSLEFSLGTSREGEPQGDNSLKQGASSLHRQFGNTALPLIIGLFLKTTRISLKEV